MKQNRIWQEEEKTKNDVYSSFEKQIRNAATKAREAKYGYQHSNYDDQEGFIIAGQASSALRGLAAKEKIIQVLRKNPYFAHIQVTEDNNDSWDFLLSDSDMLDQAVIVSEEKLCYILPFKESRDRPIVAELNRFLIAPSDEEIVVPERDPDGYIAERHYQPRIARHVVIEYKELKDVESLYETAVQKTVNGTIAQEQTDYISNSDEYLAKRLEENREDAKLRNIISTLQKQQFEIIRKNVDESFIVQGCAGSGKSQCLLHRLFFLREVLSERGWDKVLLITPTQLFRRFSAELIRRYRLSAVENVSLAQFYHTLLTAFDPRFKNRQYEFQMTEEYLPDDYLREAYAPETIEKIENCINTAIINQVETACKLLEIPTPKNRQITIEHINAIVQRLETEIARVEAIEKSIQEDSEYLMHRDAISELEKQISKQEKSIIRSTETRDRLIRDKEEYDQLRNEIEELTKQTESRKEERNREIESLRSRVQELSRTETGGTSVTEAIQRKIDYCGTLYQLNDALNPQGDRAKADNEYKDFMDAVILEKSERIKELAGSRKPETWRNNLEKRLTELITEIEDAETEVEIQRLYLNDHETWIREHRSEDIQRLNQSRRQALEHSRYTLSRIESSVFEQEVWNALQPLKEQYGIKTILTEELENNRQRQTRILYKSDLLFYLKIYMALHSTDRLPVYDLICIDEGQDLHAADYDILHKIYPSAKMNIFGDTAQVLHTACGITEWKNETGVGELCILDTNYRNTPAIVDFCNQQFASDMKYCGSIREKQKPVRVLSANHAREIFQRNKKSNYIVKDRNAYESLLSILNTTEGKMTFIDTNADEVPNDRAVCYSIYAAKGLEFTTAFVYAKEMTRNQRIVACTRAMKTLFYME